MTGERTANGQVPSDPHRLTRTSQATTAHNGRPPEPGAVTTRRQL